MGHALRRADLSLRRGRGLNELHHGILIRSGVHSGPIRYRGHDRFIQIAQRLQLAAVARKDVRRNLATAPPRHELPLRRLKPFRVRPQSAHPTRSRLNRQLIARLPLLQGRLGDVLSGARAAKKQQGQTDLYTAVER
jgi:hypothetical protein